MPPKSRTTALAILLTALAAAPLAHAFCGFYVGKADASLFNEASQVIIVRHDNKTVISMANDYRGDLKEFALVVPVPEVLQKGQVHIGDRKLFDRLDAYSAPRLVEYHDEDPCNLRVREEMARRADMVAAPMAAAGAPKKTLGVTVEATYTVGEYDIVMLSAKESDGLETWLTRNGYRIPQGASAALRPYVRQNMKFFVAKVNLAEQAKTGLNNLRPLQFAFESEKFMLPVRLGMINAAGPQDLVIYALTRNGRVETTNYRTTRVPSDMDLPVHVRETFPAFYKTMFERQSAAERLSVVFTEYFWNMGWCDPCAADPLSPEELRSAGVFWLDDTGDAAVSAPSTKRRALPGAAAPVMLTRLHVRYARDSFPEDLAFQETKDQQNFQARYVLRHAWQGDANQCAEAGPYLDRVAERQQREAQTLARLTGWDLSGIREKMDIKPAARREWWRKLWK